MVVVGQRALCSIMIYMGYSVRLLGSDLRLDFIFSYLPPDLMLDF